MKGRVAERRNNEQTLIFYYVLGSKQRSINANRPSNAFACCVSCWGHLLHSSEQGSFVFFLSTHTCNLQGAR